MRWQELFSDFEGQLDAARAEALDSDASAIADAERASTTLVARLANATAVRLLLADGASVQGDVVEAAATWLLVREGAREHLVPLAAITGAVGLPRASRELKGIGARLGIGHALRALAESGQRVLVVARGLEVGGVIESVGADYFEVASDDGKAVAVTVAGLLRVSAA